MLTDTLVFVYVSKQVYTPRSSELIPDAVSLIPLEVEGMASSRNLGVPLRRIQVIPVPLLSVVLQSK